MTAPHSAPEADVVDTSDEEQTLPPLMRATIWVAIGALIAAALVCVVWVLIGEQNGIIGRAFLTVLLLSSFAGVTILDVHLAPRRPSWFALASMVGWVALLLIGAIMIWMPERGWWGASSRFISFLLIVLIFQLALLHVRLYAKALERRVTTFTLVVAIVTVVLVVTLVVLLTLPLMLSEYIRFHDIYGRIVVAVAILAAVGTALLPLVNVLFSPRKRRPAAVTAPPTRPGAPAPFAAAPAQPYGALAYGATAAGGQAALPAPAPSPGAPTDQRELLPWPTFVDGATPLPMLPDGSPDWNAYYTGRPTPGAFVFETPAVQHPSAGAAEGVDAAPEPAAPAGADAHVPAAPEAVAPETAAPAVAAPEAVAPEAAAPAENPPAAAAEPGDVDYRSFPPPPPLPPRA